MAATQLWRKLNGRQIGGIGLSLGLLWTLVCVAPAARADVRESVKRSLPATVCVEWHGVAAKAVPATSAVPATGDEKDKVTFKEAVKYRLKLLAKTPDQVSMASGTIVSADGLIVTMVKSRESGEYSVTLDDGRALPARLLVDDRRNGLKLLKVDAAGLPFLMSANQPPQIGEEVTWTYCLGVKERAAARGIIASTGRELPGLGTDLLQLDAEAPQMSAGAPLVDEKGRLMGVVAYSRGGDSMRSGYAFPASTIRTLVDALPGHGTVVLERGMIGIALSRTGADGPVVVAHPTTDSPAAAAGIVDGDIVLAIDGVKVGTPEEIMRLVSAHVAGQKVKVTIRREGAEKDFEVPLVPVPAAPVANPPVANPNSASGSSGSSGGGGTSTGSSSGGAPITIPGPAQIPPRVTAVRPDSIYIVDSEGQLRAVPIDPNDKALEPLRKYYDSLYKSRQDATLAVPSIQIQRSDMEKKLEAIGRDVLTLRQQMEKLTEELQRLQKQLSAAPAKP